MISLDTLTVSYGGWTLFDNISFLINPQDRIGLVGRNGAGKTTLLRIITGEQQPTSGSVTLNGDCTIGYLPQTMRVADTTTLVEETAKAFEEVLRLEAEIEHLTREIAECIYVGVSTDTGCFKFSNTTAHTHAVAAACLTAGIDGGEINRALFETKSRPRFEMERIVFDTMEFHEDGAIAVAVLWRKDIDRVGADMDDLDSIASLTRQIEGVQIGITMTEKADGTVRVSVRTTREMDASAICKRVGGGGHVRAAGASFTCGMDEAKAEMLRVAKEQFHAAD